MSDSVRPHRGQPTRLPRPWDSSGKNTGVGCHFLLQCMKVKSESEVTQSCPTPSDLMDCSPPGSSIHGIFQVRGLEWGAIAFSAPRVDFPPNQQVTRTVRYLPTAIIPGPHQPSRQRGGGWAGARGAPYLVQLPVELRGAKGVCLVKVLAQEEDKAAVVHVQRVVMPVHL